MTGFLHKLLRKTSDQRIITYFNHQKQRPLELVFPPVLPPPIISGTKFNANLNLNPTSDSSTKEKTTQYDGFQIYPSFSFGYFLNPISASGFDQSQPMETGMLESDESPMVWADSVKKKRKKKMNKHKLKKLRKRLRHHA